MNKVAIGNRAALTDEPDTNEPDYVELPVFSEEEKKEIVEHCVTITCKVNEADSAKGHCEIMFDTDKLSELLSKWGKY